MISSKLGIATAAMCSGLAVTAVTAQAFSGAPAFAAAKGGPAVKGGTAAKGSDAAAVTDGVRGAAWRGQVVSATRLGGLSVGDARKELTSAGFDARMVKYGVDRYRLVYRTVDPQGRPTTASGLLTLPRNTVRRLRTVSFAHGTESYKADSPSMDLHGFLAGPPITYGSAGFASVAPDYLGMGVGPGVHPYMDVPSETTASLDLLRAARTFVPKTGHTLRPEVMVTGFSQGASAALGLARALNDNADPRFRLTAVAPISGAYDFQHAELPALLNGPVDRKISTAYLAYILVAWNRLHHLYDTPAELFQAPYADHVEKLFDGTTQGPDMLKALPSTPQQLFTERGLDLLRNPSGRFAAALGVLDNVCSGWKPAPKAPIHLYVSSKDDQAVAANTTQCAQTFRAAGVRAPAVEVGTLNAYGSTHIGSNILGTAAAVRWFASLR